MNLAIFGAGALGGYFGARLAAAGHRVAFIARGAHLAALQRDGLRVESALGDAHLPAVEATGEPADIGPVDQVLMLVKLPDTEAAARQLGPLLGEHTAVACFQNGVDGAAMVGDVIGAERVFGGSAYIFADLRAPGVVRHRGSIARLVFGEFGAPPSPRVSALAAALADAAVDHEVVDDARVRTWEKFVLLAAVSGVTTLTRLSIDQVLADGHCASLFRDAMEETAAVGRRECPALAEDIAARQFAFTATLPPGMRSSMFDDLSRGKPLELAWLSGAVARRGAQHGIATPVHDAIFRALHPYADGAPGGG